jgi:class 3 adenylate cyclase
MGVRISEQGKKLFEEALGKWHSTYEDRTTTDGRLRSAEECLAKAVPCSSKTVDRFMKGCSVSETTANAICAVLRLNLEELLKSGEASICEEEGAIVFTDIVDSTRIQRKHGEKKYMEIIRALEAIENENLSKYQGKRNNFTGDGHLFIFEEVKGAVLWAIDVQRKLTEKPPVDKLQIRIGIHRGKFAKDAGNDNIGGLDVNFAQRVMSLAQGGTVLISQVVKEDIEADPLEDVELYYQGKFYLKRFEDEQSEIYEVLWDGKKPTPIDEWPIICKNRLHEYQRLTTNPLTNSNINFQDVYTPLALVVRKKKSEPTKQEFPPQERGFSPQGNAKQSEEATLQQIAEDDFLEALRSGNGLVSQGFRIAIVGEPGSGKTTRLQRLAKWIFDEALGLPIWVPLAELENGSLSNYLEGTSIYSKHENETQEQ